MNIMKYIKEEIEVIKERDPAIKKTSEVFLYPSFHAILRYRLSHWLFLRKHYFLARWVSQRATRKTGIEIHPGAVIGAGLFIDHGHGVVIGETAIIGNNVTLYQGVTLGGTGKEHGKRHPTIGDNVMISAGAKVLGSFTVGEDSKIGAGSVVLSEVPANSTVVGIPGRVVKRNDKKITHPQDTLDQIHFPDPIRHELCRLQIRIENLEKGKGGLSLDALNTLEEERCRNCPEYMQDEL
ncbi:serine O-acetyltransferase [Petrocella atlantisensis]|uniref:Serine acetyltransferase n=1 Tax=Petrocella atlantisensis TaxID=2173034 RepID=A0A3P7RVR9_9FIRM|nr:serine O-acetyltransferase [Petrocella atlantisensis]MCF8019950.1 serine O-acetyltransferase [Vallitaleaceae bacterium]PKM55632.1 MAG: serine O-acetyltransferase [Firmicutes bacterium HGW-Firmicutes-5]VDN46822.1 serine O-acetyltransferase [Petrocella atlantisensis]